MGLRTKWAAGEETLGLWLTLPGIVLAEISGQQKADYVCVDMQHGAIEYSQCAQMIAGIALGGGSSIVRVPVNEPGIIGRALDAGAQGVIVPMVNTRAHAEAVVDAVRYAPRGTRSWGPLMAAMRQRDYFAWAEQNIAAIPMIETATALENLEEIVSVPGIDAVYVGPADLAISLGLGTKPSEDDPVLVEAYRSIVSACDRHGVVPGIHATGDLAKRLREVGFRMITVGVDSVGLRRALRAEILKAQAPRYG